MKKSYTVHVTFEALYLRNKNSILRNVIFAISDGPTH